MRSMTGFGRGEGRAKTVHVVAEVKTVNHKYHDLAVKLPGAFQVLEPEVREMILASVTRGKVDLFLKDLSPARAKKVAINEALVAEYLKAVKKASSRFKLKGELSPESLLRLPDVLVIEEEERLESDQRKAVGEAVQEALRALEKMRQSEGTRLAKDMTERAREITGVVQQLRQRHKALMAEKIKAFREKIGEFLPEPLQEQSRLATEEGVILQRHDIAEELTRLDSHLEALLETLKEKNSVGRKLDFLVQEMNREANTTGSKSSDAKMAQGVVRLKELLEQIREQIQNIE
ncbi:MAG TPA: YicC/YloC family endoribonuclease [bacterium]|nr:YicC/YloC family endoribonuclease [bacterium]